MRASLEEPAGGLGDGEREGYKDQTRDDLQGRRVSPGVRGRDFLDPKPYTPGDQHTDLVRQLDKGDHTSANCWRRNFGLVGCKVRADTAIMSMGEVALQPM